MGDNNRIEENDVITNRTNSPPNEQRSQPIDFDDALKWAHQDVQQKREAKTWSIKFIYVIVAIIVTIILLGLLYIYYRRTDNNCQYKAKLLDSLNETSNCLSPVDCQEGPLVNKFSSFNESQPCIGRSPANYHNIQPPTINSNSFQPTNNFGPGNSVINSPGGTLMPAVENGVQTGWWLYPRN